MDRNERRFGGENKLTMPVSSSKDCTGLVPSGGDLSETEADSYEEIYPFIVPPAPDKHTDRKDMDKARRMNRF